MVILYCARYLQQISLLFATISAILDYTVVFLWYLAELRDVPLIAVLLYQYQTSDLSVVTKVSVPQKRGIIQSW